MYVEKHRKVTYGLKSEMNSVVKNKTRLEIHVNQVRIDVIRHFAASGPRCAGACRALCVWKLVNLLAPELFFFLILAHPVYKM